MNSPTSGAVRPPETPLRHLNSIPADEFVFALSGVFERSPWVPERIASLRPFDSGQELLRAMCAAVERATADEQMALIRAHPELAGRAAIRGELTLESEREQQGAGLAACSPEEFARLQELNAGYKARFGFPFILAVRGHNRTSVISALEQRSGNTIERERAVALEQIDRIAAFRLGDLLGEKLV
jgi:OHCU decarboxylase